MDVQTETTLPVRYVKAKASVEPYRSRVKLAREAAADGKGWEDLTVAFRIGAELAKRMVGL